MNRLILKYGSQATVVLLAVFAWVIYRRIADGGVDAIIPLAATARRSVDSRRLHTHLLVAADHGLGLQASIPQTRAGRHPHPGEHAVRRTGKLIPVSIDQQRHGDRNR